MSARLLCAICSAFLHCHRISTDYDALIEPLPQLKRPITRFGGGSCEPESINDKDSNLSAPVSKVASVDFDFNTLFANPARVSATRHNVPFGKYILDKWKSVQRDD